MGRTSKKELEEQTLTEESKAMEEQSEKERTAEVGDEQMMVEEELPANVDELLKLYPQYEEVHITVEGFVHPVGVPEYLLKNAIKYKNKYFKQ